MALQETEQTRIETPSMGGATDTISAEAGVGMNAGAPTAEGEMTAAEVASHQQQGEAVATQLENAALAAYEAAMRTTDPGAQAELMANAQNLKGMASTARTMPPRAIAAGGLGPISVAAAAIVGQSLSERKDNEVAKDYDAALTAAAAAAGVSEQAYSMASDQFWHQQYQQFVTKTAQQYEAYAGDLHAAVADGATEAYADMFVAAHGYGHLATQAHLDELQEQINNETNADKKAALQANYNHVSDLDTEYLNKNIEAYEKIGNEKVAAMDDATKQGLANQLGKEAGKLDVYDLMNAKTEDMPSPLREKLEAQQKEVAKEMAPYQESAKQELGMIRAHEQAVIDKVTNDPSLSASEKTKLVDGYWKAVEEGRASGNLEASLKDFSMKNGIAQEQISKAAQEIQAGMDKDIARQRAKEMGESAANVQSSVNAAAADQSHQIAPDANNVATPELSPAEQAAMEKFGFVPKGLQDALALGSVLNLSSSGKGMVTQYGDPPLQQVASAAHTQEKFQERQAGDAVNGVS